MIITALQLLLLAKHLPGCDIRLFYLFDVRTNCAVLFSSLSKLMIGGREGGLGRERLIAIIH